MKFDFKTYKNKRTGQLTLVLSKKKLDFLKANKKKYLKLKVEDLK